MEEKRNYHEPCTCNQPDPRQAPCPRHKNQPCNGSKGNCFCLPPKVVPVEVDGCPILFRKVEIPASVGDETTDPPVPGRFRNTLVVYAASQAAYLYSSDGMPTRIDGHGDATALWEAINKEIEDREEADRDIWTEIETIEASSDVVDVVGTYAELQQYDTSKLHANDLIKVLADETRDDAITYYRWNGTAFTYVGAEGPYYTASETDTLLSGKQDTLIAGSNIQIAADGKTISATDTTYTHFTGATASADGTQGLVPGPLAGDENKFLAGDGTWQTVQGGSTQTIFYMNASETGSTRHLYKASDMTGLVTMQDIIDANEEGQVIIRISTSVTPSNYSDMYLQNAYVASGDYQMIFLDNQYYYSFDATQTSANTFQFAKSEVQRRLTAGTNIQINGTTISATDTTYSAFTGATSSVAGSAGLVPAPTTSDPDKFLKGDGTWGTISQYTPTVFYIDRSLPVYGSLPVSSIHVYKDSALTETATLQELYDAIDAGGATLVHLSSGLAQTYNFLYALHSLHNGNPDSGGDYMYFVGDHGAVLHVDTQSGFSTNNPAILYAEVDGFYSVNVMSGATSGHDGYMGLVPSPASADRDKFLKGDGTWGAVTTNALLIKEWS